jgi:hypothetical protein
MAGLGWEDEIPQGMSIIERMSTVVFPIGRPAVMDRDAFEGEEDPEILLGFLAALGVTAIPRQGVRRGTV